ncbi:MAG: glycosyltransferase, partial [Bryobacteraceae bacterium]
MPDILVTVAIPTLAADARLRECVSALEKQTLRDFEVMIVDNSGQGLVRRIDAARPGIRVIERQSNIGFGPAINAAFRQSRGPYLATLNDDAVAHPGWLAALVSAMESRPEVGMCASQVRLYGEDALDSAGMLVAGDGTGKQRGHLRPPKF